MNRADKDARTYRRLAAYARCHRYPRVTRHVVRKWVVAGLLPHAERIYDGWGPPRIAQPVDTGRLLLRLCMYRYTRRLGRLDLVAANVFLDGYRADRDRVRKAMAWSFAWLAADSSRRVRRHPRGSKVAIAQDLSRNPIITAGLPALDASDRALLVYELGSRRRGAPLGAHTRRVLGRIGDATPAVTASVQKFSGRIPMRQLRALERTTDAELSEARDLLVAYPEISAGVDRIRSHRTRTAWRLLVFAGLLDSLRSLSAMSG